jgi:hypothetical protein
MYASATALSAAQTARVISLPREAAGSPGRVAALETFRQRNALLDSVFYDVKVVGEAEAAAIGPWYAAEGAILVVPPSGRGALTLHASVDDFFAEKGGEVTAVAIAGVGSSALGSAAFARNVADAIGEPVAAVVSGYGLADLLTEALGGFFWFGGLNSLRHGFEQLDRLTVPASRAMETGPSDGGGLARTSRDTRTLMAMLGDARLRPDLLVGHSKGNLVLSEALYGLRKVDAARTRALAKAARIVTVGARIAMPPPFPRVVDVMGEWDWFGRLNSRPDIPPDHIVPGAWHHTNTELPAHLPVTETLRHVLRTH